MILYHYSHLIPSFFLLFSVLQVRLLNKSSYISLTPSMPISSIISATSNPYNVITLSLLPGAGGWVDNSVLSILTHNTHTHTYIHTHTHTHTHTYRARPLPPRRG